MPSISATIVPAFGLTMPMMHFMSVDLPLPLVPSSATVSPLPTLSDTLSITRTAPYAAWIPAMVRLLAKISPFDLGIAHDLVRYSIGNFSPGNQYDQSARETHYGTHNVLNQNDGHALLIEADEQRQNVLDFRMGKPRHSFVGNQKLRLGRHRTGELQFAHLDLGEITRQVVRLLAKSDLTQEHGTSFLDLVRGMVSASLRHGIEEGDSNVVGKREAHEWPRQLEAAA